LVYEGGYLGKRIVILGGGVGGLVVAHRLRKAPSKDNDIVLVDKEKNHLYQASLLWVMSGHRKKEYIQKPLSLLKKKNIKFLNASVQKIDFENKTVSTSNGDVNFDYLVIALGAGTFPDRIPGFSEGAYNLYDLSGAENLRESVKGLNKGRLVVLITSKPFKCPAAPYEAALLLSAYLTKERRKVEIEVVTPEQLPMGLAGSHVGNMVVHVLKSKGIRFTPEHQTSIIDPAKKEISFQQGDAISYDFLVGIPPHGVPSVLNGSPVLGESGWVKVNPGTLETGIEDVYALGDVTSIPLAVGKPLPKAGVFAHYQADVVAHNIAAKINGRAKKEFDGRGSCFLEIGNGKAGYASGNFYTKPKPVVKLRKPSRFWHWGKVVFEKWWLWRWF